MFEVDSSLVGQYPDTLWNKALGVPDKEQGDNDFNGKQSDFSDEANFFFDRDGKTIWLCA